MNPPQGNPFQGCQGAELIWQSWQALAAQLDYLSPNIRDTLLKTTVYAARAHDGQVRKADGAPYITHPLAVAKILAQLHYGATVLQGALLHDVLEDTAISSEEMAKAISPEVTYIVQGVSKIQKIKESDPKRNQAGSFLNMLEALIQDPRVLLVKLADRLHNLQTLDAFPPEKQKRIARETVEVYVHLSQQLGMFYFASQLEDLAFQYLYPWRAKIIKHHYEKNFANDQLVREIDGELQRAFAAVNLENVKVIKRRRYLYGIYDRMRRKGSFAAAIKTATLRIITRSEDDCYRALGRVHHLYRPIDDKFRDYIALAKKNGYQALHSSVLRHDQNGERVLNVQICTETMDKLAELGLIASFYNENNFALDKGFADQARHQLTGWLSKLREIGSDGVNPLVAYETIKEEIGQRQTINLFTPRNDRLELPLGATALDFAYNIHSEIGNHCRAARVNGRDFAIYHPLPNGATVEILCDPQAQPSPDWLKYVVSPQARQAINRYLHRQDDRQALKLGRELLINRLESQGYQLEQVQPELDNLLKQEKISAEALFMAIGRGRRSVNSLMLALLKGQELAGGDSLIVRRATADGIYCADCCTPLPYEPIVGRLTAQGCAVHRKNCELAVMDQQDPLVQCRWAEPTVGLFIGQICIEAANRPGLLFDVSAVLKKYHINIQNMLLDEQPLQASDRSTLLLWLELRDLQQLQDIKGEMRKIDGVANVYRVMPQARDPFSKNHEVFHE